MARSSEGSNIEVELEKENSDSDDVPADPIRRDQWMSMLLEDEEDDLVGDELCGFQNEWTREPEEFVSQVKTQYNRLPGLKITLPESVTPSAVFSRFFTEELWMRLVTETNQYAEQTRSATPMSPSGKWSPVTLEEMKCFIGLCLTMGILKLPSRRDYWRQKKWLFQARLPEVMARDWFTMIWRYLHLQDNTDTSVDHSDKLWKVRGFLEYLTRRFQEVYEVDGHATVDESMVKFKGRLAFRQYLPLKPIKWGIKMWVMAESSTGYCTNFQVYSGHEGPAEKGLAHRVVMDLTRPYYGSHLSVYMDNFYSGVELYEEMKLKGLDACGTIRAGRKGLPPKPSVLPKPEYQVAQKDNLTFCAWQDTKVVMVLSNHHDPTATGKVHRRKHMKGVDLLDQMVGYYLFNHRSKKWWRRIFFFSLMVSCYNSYVVGRSAGWKAGSGYKDWVEDLAMELVTDVRVKSAAQHASRPAGAVHNVQVIFEKRKVCSVCSQKPGHAGATLYGCRQCNVPLHPKCLPEHRNSCFGLEI